MTTKELKAIAKLMGVIKLEVRRRKSKSSSMLYHSWFIDEHSWATFTNSHETFIERLGRHITEYQQEQEHDGTRG